MLIDVDLVFSVIIPTYNRPAALQDCLEALARQCYPQDAFEVIVINDGGSECLNGMEGVFQDHLNYTMLRQQRRGPATARNCGARRARGKYLVFTDDDCRPSCDWLLSFEQSLRIHPDSLVGGRVLNAVEERRCSAASQHLLDFLYQSYTEDGRPRFFASNNIAVSRSGFWDLAGFDESFPLAAAEDRDFCARWSRAGRLLISAPAAVVHHFHKLTLSGFIRQHFRYGRGALSFRRRSLATGRAGASIEPLSFYFHLLLYPFQLEICDLRTRVQLSLLFLLSQLANTLGYLFESVSFPARSGRCDTAI